MVEVKNMSREDLVAELHKIRESRKRGYTQTPKVRRKKEDAFAGLSTELAEKLLAELAKGG